MKRYSKQRSSSKVVWDEANLNFLEANKTPKRKITEPKTPYHPPKGAMNNAEHAQAICDALSEVASSSDHGNSRGGEGSASEEEEEEEEDSLVDSSNCNYDTTGLGRSGSRLSFTEQRKAHYDEFRKSKSLSQKDLVVNDAEEDLDKGQVQEMVIDGIGAVDLHDPASPSASWQRNTCKQPRCS